MTGDCRGCILLRGGEFVSWWCALGHDLMSIDDIPEPFEQRHREANP